jgi:thiol-disulfide isomerase/thioredoxin
MSQEPTAAGARPATSGLAVASLVLGLLALVLSPVVIGGVLGLLGLALGLVHLSRRGGSRGMAVGGLALSGTAVLASVAAAGLYYYTYDRFVVRMASRTPGFAAWHGKDAPALTLRTIDGEAVDTAALRGRPVVLNFWATWCGPCRKEIPHLDRLARDAPSNLVVLSVSDEDPETLRQFRAGTPMSYAVVSADGLPAPYGQVRAYPTTFFIGTDGRIRSVVTGYQDFETLRERALATTE